jgi:hypothetical protein
MIFFVQNYFGEIMRPIERKILNRIDDKGLRLDDVLEIIDRTTTQEMKKSFPDDCHFQSDKYFANTILKALERYKLIRKDGSKYFRNDKKNEEKNKQS